ncbi:MAG: NADH-quinone oxidoreductase subunit C [Planctomycetota bacterium]
MTSQEIFEQLKRKFGDKILTCEEPAGPVPPCGSGAGNSPALAGLKIEPAALPEVMSFLKDSPEFYFDSLMCLSGVDYPGLPAGEAGHLTVVYHLFSTSHNHKIVLKTTVSKGAHFIPTVSHIWPAADWFEREAYDLLGIKFEGHPNLTRILMPDDWAGHPLRKDYQYPKEYHGVPHS